MARGGNSVNNRKMTKNGVKINVGARCIYGAAALATLACSAVATLR